ncbi:MAG: YfhO family protein [Lachnospiraceae bacterium]|nr:YfhO family protein [Lachnospiraceae bacterium]
MSSFIRKHPRISLIIVTAILYLVLYGRFLFGNAVFMYSDIGSDSLSSSYPIVVMLSRLFETRTFAHYTLWDGLGADTTATFLQYINPLKLLILLFGRDNFPLGILLVVFLTHLLTSLFVFGFFRRLVGNDYAALLPSLAWSFSSYMIVWGQNYSFGQCILMFTISMFMLQGFLANGGHRWAIGLTLSYALFLISNYYFFYMAGIFSALYVILYTLFAGEENRFGLMLKRLFILLLTGIGALAVGCVSVIPIVTSFTGSARSGDTSGHALRDLVRLFDVRTYLTFAGRLFSSNLMGVGNGFTGAVNYYEAAQLATSVLFIFAVIYLFFRKGSFVKTFFSLFVIAALMVCPLAGFVLTFNVEAQRFSFIVCFAECIAIAFLMKDLDEGIHMASLVFAGALTPVAAIGGLAALYIFKGQFGYDIREKTLVLAAAFVILFTFLLFLHLSEDLRPHLAMILTVVLCAEIACMNIPSLFERDFLSKDQFRGSYFNDGTQEASAKIRSEDESLYRIATSMDLNMANEGLVDGHNSVTVYSNTNAAGLVSLTNAAGVYQKSRNFFVVGYPQYYLFTLLGGKYLITDEPDPEADSLEDTLFKVVDTTATNRTFENLNTLPFGYVYEEEISGEDFTALDGIDRMRALTAGYVRTEDIGAVGSTADNTSQKTITASSEDVSAKDVSAKSADSEGNASEEESETSELEAKLNKREKETDLRKKIGELNDVKSIKNEDGSVTMTADGADPYFVFDLKSVKTEKENQIFYLTLAADPEELDGESQIQVFLTTKEHPVPDPDFSRIYYLSKAYPQLNILLPDAIQDIRVDLGENAAITFTDMKLTVIKKAASDFKKLASTDITDILFQNDTYSATVTTKDKGCVLCVPLIYSKNWTAVVNGTQTEVMNINGGLLGILLDEGENRVAIRYAVPHFKIGAFVSIASLCILLLLFVIPLTKRRS